MRRVPIGSTFIVIAAVLTMIGLGVWQLERLQWKQNLLVHYATAMSDSAEASYPSSDPQEVEAVLFRRATVDCRFTSEWNSISGRNTSDKAGYVHIVLCGIEGNRTAYVQAGWTQGPQHPDWKGGRVSGLIAPYIGGGARLIADPPAPGFTASAKPDPNDIPNNHLAYAVQWFFFAGVALVIYGLALRKRWRERG
ncbi:SURF1 family protein [Novosphingobium taihuense]|uniref:SURF1-like protein n=1 Tax=Novosphingobium taihuense TaxID=260085 RepID=A0A7W7AA39_9SPHN|nr:SURF1 family protein [Novosphingobium taihuense]MBB4613224.1 surfeit locus 1 family protein [Novosphingobium taihuense]TWH85365.1 surfeit locus 1 family protein [Novosphingobium taihuense]